MSSFFNMAQLSRAFERIPRGTNLLNYLAFPYHFIKGVHEKAFIALKNRTPFEECTLGCAGNDTKIYKSRFSLTNDDNRAFYLACKDFPDVIELEEFSTIKAQWSVLKSIKDLLHHNPELAMKYQGLVPFGRPVIMFYNKLTKSSVPLKGPSFKDHLELQRETNILAKKYGVSSIIINDMMYLGGNEIQTEINKTSTL